MKDKIAIIGQVFPEFIIQAAQQSNVFLNEPIPITRLKVVNHLPKVNCKKGHTYQRHEDKEKDQISGLIKVIWKCRCGKEL